MKTRLFINSTNITDPNENMQEISYSKYIFLRLQFWKYRLKHTMGRPVLRRWKA